MQLPVKNHPNGFSLKLIHNSRGSWKEHIEFTKSSEEFMKKVNAIIKLHGADTYASFKASLKINGGFCDNKETGTTHPIMWKGRLDKIFELLPFPKVEHECESCNGTGWQCHSDNVEMYNDCEDDYDCDNCLKKGDKCPDCEGTGEITGDES